MRSFVAASVAVMLAFAAGCSSSEDASTPADASVQETGSPETGADAGAEAASEAEAPDTGTGEDGASDGGCSNYQGAYVTSGTCNSPSYVMPSVVCVNQTGCQATVYATGGQVFTGQATSSGFEVHTKTPVDETCTGSVTEDTLSISCKADSFPIECSGTGEKAEVADTTGTCCDVVKQDCPASSRCTLVGVDPAKGPWITGCVAVGAKAESEACTRTAPGRDDCGAGLYCSLLSVADGSTKCRKLCGANGDCGAGAGCAILGSTPVSGICIPTCEFFPDSCGAGMACSVVSALGDHGSDALNSFCLVRGTKKAGDACQAADECEAGTKCDGNSSATCKAICDDAHPCSSGTCKMVSGLLSGATVGVCE